MTNFLDSKILKAFLPVFIFLFAFAIRVYGINWDQNQHLHPDERFLTMTVDAMVWPENISEYLSPSVSKLNPYNIGTSFYVYGTLPTTIVKYFSKFEIFDKFQYNNIALTGRLISAMFDVGVVILIFLITLNIFNRKTAILASFLYSVSVLPIQLSHFFAVDTFLNFFLVLSFYFLIKLISEKKIRYCILLGLTYGAALACKISALYFLPIILVGLLIFLLKYKNILLTSFFLLITFFCIYLSFRILDTHVFLVNIFPPKINPQFVQNIKQLKSFDGPNTLFPPAVQWLTTKPIIFPLKNIIIWGLGLPLGVISFVSIIFLIYKALKYLINVLKKKTKTFNNLTIEQYGSSLILFWILFLFTYQGLQFTKTMRYFLPIFPFLTIISANFSINFLFKKFKSFYLLLITYCLLLIIWPISFLKIYSHPHSRVTASEWIYQNIPKGSTLSCDAWDDCLPLNIEGVGYLNQYKILSMEPFATNTPEKQILFSQQLQQIDYLVLTSNRAWGSLTKVPEKYPFMSKFYKDLFSEKLNFTKVAEITSYPTIPILNIPIPDQLSEEVFTVYDHPKILIYKQIHTE